MNRDRRLLYATAFVRAVATGAIGILLGMHLEALVPGAGEGGAVVAAGLAGGAAAALVATLHGDRIGRRRLLVALALLGAAGGALVAMASGMTLLAIAGFFGMVNGMGRDRGAAAILEQAALPATATDETRTRAFAIYNVLMDAGHALGALLAALPALARDLFEVGHVPSLRAGVLGYAALALIPAFLYPRLTRAVESPRGPAPRAPLSPASRRIVTKISALFAMDSLGGGFLTSALVAWFFHERFGVDERIVGPLFFAARVANALSHLAAARLARRFGLVNTMVFTHIPSSLLLVTVAIAPSFPIAAALFLLREGLVEMDVPTRQSYVMAVVRPEERTVASGTTQLVRLAAWAVAPAFAGLLMTGSLVTPLLAGAGLKILYDLLLWRAFRKIRPPEEERATASTSSPSPR